MGRRIGNLLVIIFAGCFLISGCNDISLLQRLEELVQGAGIDTTPPGAVTDLALSPGNEEITLDWTNPNDADFAGVKIIYKTDSAPVDITDGTEVYSGAESSFNHTGLLTDENYFYSVFTYDTAENYATGVEADTSPLGPEMSIWGSTTGFPSERAGFLGLVCRDHLYVLGGVDGSSRYSTVQYAQIQSDNTVGAWNTTGEIFTPLNSFSGFSYNNRIYMFHGENGSIAFNDVQYADVNVNGTIDAWSSAADLPISVRGSASTEYNGYAYVTGGNWSGTTYTDVYFGKIENDGNIISWTSTTSIPAGNQREGHLCLSYNGYIYVLGGDLSSNNYTDSVFYTSINTDGTLNTWQTTTSLPVSMGWGSGVALNGYIYILGGWDGTLDSDKVYRSKIHADGTLSDWVEVGSFSTARRSHQAAVGRSVFYVLGGGYGTPPTILKDIQFARLIP